MLTNYVRAAMRRARYEILSDDGTFYGEIPGFDGVYANSKALEACREELEEVLEECKVRFDDEMLENLAIEKIRIQANLTEIVSLFDGAIELLEELQGRIKIALATMSSRKVVGKLLSEKRIGGYFDVVVSADEIVKPKPDPEVFFISATKLGLKPEDCVVVEDSVFGVRAAKAAKMMCIVVSSGAYSREELEEENPDLMIDSLVEKARVLGFVFGSM